MATKPDSVTWQQFGIMAAFAFAVAAGGFTWLHMDMNDMKQSVRDVTTQVSDVKTAIATTNSKLDILIEETRKRH